ncbi:hypothetical protein DKX38_007053 [Salix brachista]|uniref:Bulb-type lectin domain-containing protein n=1 Tax=Salix brachista TaxID=2182728 RepID=A0A5N5MM40_9ROSI|nr:hypothetical protein DKX38_007053 [Salix brachista]
MPHTTKAEAVIRDDGNFVIRDGSNPSTIYWQSFDYPTDTWLPGAKLGINKHTGQLQRLISWKNSEDPAPGMFSIGIDPNGNRQFFIEWNRPHRYWSTGDWNGQTFSSVPEMRLNYLFNYSYVSNENERYLTYSLNNNSLLSRFVIGVHGQMQQLTWWEGPWSWTLVWSQPRDQAGVYGLCGVFGVFHENSSSFCECLKGRCEESNTDEDVELKPERDVIHDQESKLSNDSDRVPVIDIFSEELKLAQDDELKQDKDVVSNEHSKLAQDMESNSLNKEIITANAVDPKLASDIDEMKSKLHVAELKLSETKSSISKLAEEKRQSCQETKILQEELDFLDEAQILELKMMSRERGDEPSALTKKLEENQNESFRTEILTQQVNTMLADLESICAQKEELVNRPVDKPVIGVNWCQNKSSVGKEDGFLKMSDLALPANSKTYQKVSAGRCRLDCMENSQTKSKSISTRKLILKVRKLPRKLMSSRKLLGCFRFLLRIHRRLNKGSAFPTTPVNNPNPTVDEFGNIDNFKNNWS